ncbi:hypothetical protein C8J57DRAFT_1276980 [Mycena rebaudengoi]|nr:hypothetical protein C8J57DRAFT_1276980 [Mycena rebaudengoi]
MAHEASPLVQSGPARVDRDTSQSQHEHFCARCSTAMGSEARPPNHRRKLLYAACLAVVIFAFAIAAMCTAWQFEKPSIVQLFVALWSVPTIAVLVILYCMSRIRDSPVPVLSNTLNQVCIVSALGLTWFILVVAMLTQNTEICTGWGKSHVGCAMFTTSHVFSWVLFIALFYTAYAIYSRAVAIHGAALVPLPGPPPVIAAWKLSVVADDEGVIKI